MTQEEKSDITLPEVSKKLDWKESVVDFLCRWDKYIRESFRLNDSSS